LAAMLNVSTSAVANIESGRISSWPRIRRDLAALFQVKESVLFDADGRPL